MIDDLRAQVAALIRDLPAEALNWRPLDDDDHATNSPAVLAAHVAGAERFWIAEVVGQRPSTRQRDQEFVTRVESAAPLLARLDAVAAETRQVLAALTAADLHGTRPAGDKTVPVRWAILHVIDHTALHLGHMQITVQLWRGGQATEMPRWFQRLPGKS